jgi:hypothetical protein
MRPPLARTVVFWHRTLDALGIQIGVKRATLFLPHNVATWRSTDDIDVQGASLRDWHQPTVFDLVKLLCTMTREPVTTTENLVAFINFLPLPPFLNRVTRTGRLVRV